jgi:murein DD-endopeptidase MepM/ murein hydrolase activator NlpD
MMGRILRFLRYVGVTLGVVSLVLLAKEVGEDYERGDMKAVIVKLSAAGFGALASGLAYTAGIALAGTGVGIVKGGLIIAGSAGIGIGVEEGIRRGFLGSPEQPPSEVTTTQPSRQPSTQPSTPKISTPSVMPPLPPTGTLGTGAQAYGAPRAGGTRKHAGVDFDPADDKNSKFFSRIGGEVIYAANAGGGYGNVVDIYNAELGVTERIAEGNKIHVKKGDIVKPGTLVQSGSEMTGVFHYEIRKGRAGHSGAFEGTVDPLKFLEQLKTNQNQASIRTSPSSLISSTGLNQSTTYSSEGMSVRREVNNIFIPIAA